MHRTIGVVVGVVVVGVVVFVIVFVVVVVVVIIVVGVSVEVTVVVSVFPPQATRISIVHNSKLNISRYILAITLHAALELNSTFTGLSTTFVLIPLNNFVCFYGL